MSYRFVKLTASCLALTALAGCVPHLTQAQCQSMNWYQVGFNDGQQGKNQRDLNRAISDCAKFKLTVNTQGYARGWRAGTRKYCRPSNGYRLGTNGIQYNSICPSDMTRQFNRAWRRGLRRYCTPDTGYNLGRAGRSFPSFCAPDQLNAFRNAYDRGMRRYRQQASIQADLAGIDARINSTKGQINNTESDIRNWENQLAAGGSGNTPRQRRENRRALKANIRNGRNSLSALRSQLDQLYRERARERAQLNRVKGS